MASTISPESVLKQLDELWVSLGNEPQGEDRTGVLRACSMTLIIVCDHADDVMEIGETLAALMPEHPSRAMLVKIAPSGERALEARVSAQCWTPFGRRRQICCEQIEITGSEAALSDLPAVLVPLAAPDLPVMLWCRSARLFSLPDFRQVAEVAHKIIVDSSALDGPRAGLERIASEVRSGTIVGDLSWTRLTRWRELIAQVFENRKHLQRLGDVGQLRICFSESEAPVAALYMAAWLMLGLRKAGAAPQLHLEAEAGSGHGELCHVHLAGEGIELSLSMTEGQAAEVRVDSLTSHTLLPAPSPYLLMREELAITGHDPVYESVLEEALRLAQPH